MPPWMPWTLLSPLGVALLALVQRVGERTWWLVYMTDLNQSKGVINAPMRVMQFNVNLEFNFFLLCQALLVCHKKVNFYQVRFMRTASIRFFYFIRYRSDSQLMCIVLFFTRKYWFIVHCKESHFICVLNVKSLVKNNVFFETKSNFSNNLAVFFSKRQIY